MRTRFLNIDYFASSSAAETIGFLNFPVPGVTSSYKFNPKEDVLLRFCSPKEFDIETEPLPIESALSKFLSEVIPGHVDVDYGTFEIDSCSNGDYCFDEVNSLRFDDYRFYEKEDEVQTCAAASDEEKKSVEVVQFETQELDLAMGNGFNSKKEIQILSEIPQIANEPNDRCRQEFILQNQDEVERALYSVDYVSSDYFKEEQVSLSGENTAVQNQMHYKDAGFPFLEVDDINLSLLTIIPIQNELLMFLENMGTHRWSTEDRLPYNDKELLGSADYDILELFTNGCLSKKCLDSELASLGVLTQLEVIDIIDTPNVEQSISFHQENMCAEYYALLVPVTFEELEIQDLEASGIFEIFICLQKANEPEICSSMFGKENNYKSFSELVVIPELTLSDDTFKSLPTPILCDNEQIGSLKFINLRMLLELKPQSSSASDEIYLDWHLLEKDKHNHEIPCHYSFSEADSYNIDINFGLDQEKMVFDFIFSDDAFSMPCTDINYESLDDYRMVDDHSIGLISGELLDNTCPESGSRENPTRENAMKTCLQSTSMSAFDDLAFFLNPQKEMTEQNTETELKALQANAANLVLPSSDLKTSCILTRTDLGKPESVHLEQYNSRGGEASCSFKITLEAESDLMAMDEFMKDRETEKNVNQVPLENDAYMRSAEAVEKIVASGREAPHNQVPVGSEMNAVIIVNTQNIDKEMIICRRSTYQKVLAMEKEGMQVVERDSDIPADIMLSSAVCLLWYNFENIGKELEAISRTSSNSISCIENIATNVLTLLSFSFSCCILVFEGDTTFLASVMESSDELYAAAATLGIDLQVFCSYSADLTDEIIVSCIKYSAQCTRGIYPRMPESETLAESFLTKFPSVNPLTAHSILSSGGLDEFFKLSKSNRIHKMQMYFVPEESINLFTALCKYGEQEDSKSVMTDSSSSVSSGPESGTWHFNIHSAAAEEQNHAGIFEKLDINEDDLLHFEPFDEYSNRNPKLSGAFQAYDSWPSNDPQKFDDYRKPDSSLDEMFRQHHPTPDFASEDIYRLPNKSDSPITDGAHLRKGTTKFNAPLIDDLLGPNQEQRFGLMENMDRQNIPNSENLDKDFSGEVINIADNTFPVGNFYSASGFSGFPPPVPNVKNDPPRQFKSARKLSYGEPSHHTFPTAAEIASCPDMIASGNGQSEEVYFGSEGGSHKLGSKRQKTFLEDFLTRRSLLSKDLPFNEEISHCSGTPLSKALSSSTTQQSSPWTVEFLNRVRERSRVKQQARAFHTSASNLETPLGVARPTKRKSPSMLDFFKYKGGKNATPMPKGKKQKKIGSSSNLSKSEKYTPIRSWTPIDKRATKTLSFATNGRGGQTKLVWN